MANYLKKKEMYRIAKDVLKLTDSMPALGKCVYGFYRGAEWLKFNDHSYEYELHVCEGGNYLSVSTFLCDKDLGKCTRLSRKVYNGWNKREVGDIKGLCAF